MAAGGFVKLWRSIEDWEWYNDVPCRLLFMHCLVKVNRLPGTFQGEPIAPGEWPTSLPKMALGAGISEQQVRTAINKLRSTGDIRDRSTGAFRVVTICNWEHWQGSTSDDQQTGNSQTAGRSTADQQQNNDRIYPIGESKKRRRGEGKNSSQLPLSGITEKAPKAEYGDRRINELMEFLKAENGGMIDQSIKKNRQACHNLIRKAEGIRPDLDAVAGIKALITRGKAVPFHGPKITSFVYLLAHVTEIKNHIQQPNGKAASVEQASADADRIIRERYGS